jgi:biotin transport system substrate-specific component
VRHFLREYRRVRASNDRNPASAGIALRDLLVQALLAVGGSLLLAASAHVTVPAWPVPMTMQTFAVLLIGATCGARLAAAIVATYLAEAAIGLPVLATPLPLLAFGPTTGYLAGFLLAATWVGAAADRGWTRQWPERLAVLAVGEALIYAAGLVWLSIGIAPSAGSAVAAGLVPFLPGEAAKFALAVAVSGALPGRWVGLRRD